MHMYDDNVVADCTGNLAHHWSWQVPDAHIMLP